MMSFQLCLCLAPFLSAATPLESSSLENVTGLIAVGFAIEADDTRLSESVALPSTSAGVEPESEHDSSPVDRALLGRSISLTVLRGDKDDDHEDDDDDDDDHEDEDDDDRHQDKKKKDKKKDVEKSAKRKHKHSGKPDAVRGHKSGMPMGPRMSHRGPGPRPPFMHSGPPFGMTRRPFGGPGSPLQHKPFAKGTPFRGGRSFGGPFNGPKGSHGMGMMPGGPMKNGPAGFGHMTPGPKPHGPNLHGPSPNGPMPGGPASHAPMAGLLFGLLDGNHDGNLSREEFQRLAEVMDHAHHSGNQNHPMPGMGPGPDMHRQAMDRPANGPESRVNSPPQQLSRPHGPESVRGGSSDRPMDHPEFKRPDAERPAANLSDLNRPRVGPPSDQFQRPGFAGPPTGRPEAPGAAFFGRMSDGMDPNGNGKLEQEEIARIPSFVQDMMKSRGVELQAGMSLDEIRGKLAPDRRGQPDRAPGVRGEGPRPEIRERIQQQRAPERSPEREPEKAKDLPSEADESKKEEEKNLQTDVAPGNGAMVASDFEWI